MVTALTDRVWWIDLGSVNAYLVEDDVLTLVDAGMPWHADAVLAAIDEAGFDPTDVERVLVTHYDLDHVGGLSKLDFGDAPVHVGERDADLVAGRRSAPLSSIHGALHRVSGLFHGTIDAPIRSVRDGDAVGSFTAVHTPGHTRGHTAFVSEERDAAFVGDLVTSDGASLAPSSWYLNYDSDAVATSIDALVDAMPAVDVAAPGHGDPLSDGGYGALRALKS